MSGVVASVEARPGDGVVRIAMGDFVDVAGAEVVHPLQAGAFDIGDGVLAAGDTAFDVPIVLGSGGGVYDPAPAMPAGLAYPLPDFTLQPPAGRAASSDPPPAAPSGRADVR